MFNRWFHRKYTGVIVPDDINNESGLISGRLSQFWGKDGYHFPGILSSLTKKKDISQDLDIFISVSGPEPQRTAFENIVRSQIYLLPGKKVMALGIPESDKIEEQDSNTIIYHHLNRQNMEEFFNRWQILSILGVAKPKSRDHLNY